MPPLTSNGTSPAKNLNTLTRCNCRRMKYLGLRINRMHLKHVLRQVQTFNVT